MTAISHFEIIENVSHSLVYAYVHGHPCPSADTVDEWIQDEIQTSLIYYSDILDTWKIQGCPDPELPLNEFESLPDAITWAVYETLQQKITVQNVVNEFTYTYNVDSETDWLKPLTDEIA